MAMLSDILSLLEKWPTRKRITAAPDRTDALESRIRVLESALSGKPRMTTEPCPLCGEEMKITAVNPHPTFKAAGIQNREWTCGDCGHTEDRIHDPMGRMGKT